MTRIAKPTYINPVAGEAALLASWRQPPRRPADPPRTAPAGGEPVPGESPEDTLERRVRGAIEQSIGHKRTVAVVFVDLGE